MPESSPVSHSRPRTRVLIVGASARMAAQSAARADWDVTAVDLFADWDTQQIAHTHRVQRLTLVTEMRFDRSFDAIVFTGGMENHPQMARELLETHSANTQPFPDFAQAGIWQNIESTLAAAGLPVPESQLNTPTNSKHDWLIKSNFSTGGQQVFDHSPNSKTKIESATGSSHQTENNSIYWQRLTQGDSIACLFVASNDQAHLIGCTLQLIGKPELGCAGFSYCGSIGPIHLDPHETAAAQSYAQALSRKFRIRGVFGIDFVRNDRGIWPVDLNPRIPASLEIVERANGMNLIQIHFDAINGNPWSKPEGENSSTFFGKAILFNKSETQTLVADRSFFDWAIENSIYRYDSLAGPNPSRCDFDFLVADIPNVGTPILPRHPIISVIAKEQSLAKVHQRLFELSDYVDRILSRSKA